MFRAISELRGGRTPSYQELDARLGWQANRHVDISLVGRDLLHRSHAELAGGGSQLRYFRREILGRVGWTF
jgi:iron complex outermembrane receptor protein